MPSLSDIDDSDTDTPPAGIRVPHDPTAMPREDSPRPKSLTEQDSLRTRAADFLPDIEIGQTANHNFRRDEILELHVDDDPQARPGDSIKQSSSTFSSDQHFSSVTVQGYCEVYVHVYDMGPVTARLNEYILERANLGAFHVAVEVLDNEWCFQGFHDAWDDPQLSGVVRNEPRSHPGYIFRESLYMGVSPYSEDDIDNIIDDMVFGWRANSYHVVARNCVTFAEEFVQTLRVPEPFPAWLRGAADAGKSTALFPIVDYGWSWFKYFSARMAAQELEAEKAAEEEIRRKEAGVSSAGGLGPAQPLAGVATADKPTEYPWIIPWR